ncbi:isoprenyl transferase [Pokkaliibacter sp. MBI-7]|uniref:isoprenyl transferase n=1 Tax=Pokkaliibacter sp. MBI-7 TaxID=3040600 RepID=UPI00244C2B22|nr:isoprenyl transferase [Pokkaliibacter sp. MBI-7]MDH2434561.1 isoprenyl transferase [Pokkaliibacter sp. MBI-7]
MSVVFSMSKEVALSTVPRHVAIIMDGNNRWAKKRFLPGVAGHKAGVKSVRAVIDTCIKHGIEVLTLFAFSSENWRRPEDEVNALMSLFVYVLEREVKKLHKSNVRLRVVGERERLGVQLNKLIDSAEALTCNNTGLVLAVAANYGGQWDVVNACKKLVAQVQAGELACDDISEDIFNSAVSLGDLPAPDLCIRTGGEKRISNFLLWQMAYTEFYFTPTLWPDFREKQLLEAVADFSGRQRRFGHTTEQVEAMKGV